MTAHDVSSVRRDPPIAKGLVAGKPIQSHSDLLARLERINSTTRGWTTNPDYADLLPDMRDRIRQTAEKTLLQSYLDFNEGNDWTQKLMPRSGRWKIAFPIIKDDRTFVRKVPINWSGAIEIEKFEDQFGRSSETEINVPEFEVLFDEDFDIAVLDMLYVTPLTSKERDAKFEEIGKPGWSDLPFQREYGLDSSGNLVSFDPYG